MAHEPPCGCLRHPPRPEPFCHVGAPVPGVAGQNSGMGSGERELEVPPHWLGPCGPEGDERSLRAVGPSRGGAKGLSPLPPSPATWCPLWYSFASRTLTLALLFLVWVRGKGRGRGRGRGAVIQTPQTLPQRLHWVRGRGRRRVRVRGRGRGGVKGGGDSDS